MITNCITEHAKGPTMIWRRLRGHKIEPFTRSVDTSIPFAGIMGVLIEKGRIEHGHVCSCGREWS